jgi:hypothetical protein
MAAGLGFKTFTTGEVLTAADVNGYLMQGVLVFASAAARNAAITSPQEGQFAFTKDTNGLWYYDGAAWVASGATGDIEGVTAGIGISGGGTSGTVTVTNSMATAIDAKGDLVAGTGADAFSRLAVGANDTVLTADSAEATGLKWAAAASTSGPAFRAYRATSAQTFSQNTATKVQFNAESFDTDNCFDSTTNYRFTPTKSGYYQLGSNLTFDGTNSASLKEIYIYKNGSRYADLFSSNGSGTAGATCNQGSSTLIYFNGSTDYAEIYVYDSDAVARAIKFGEPTSYFTGVWIRS